MDFCCSSASIKWPLRCSNERSEKLTLLCNVLFQFCLLAGTSLFNFAHWVVTFTMKDQDRYVAGQAQSQTNGLWLHSLTIQYTAAQKSCLKGSTAPCVYLDTKVSRGRAAHLVAFSAGIISPLRVNCAHKSCLLTVPLWLMLGCLCVPITTNKIKTIQVTSGGTVQWSLPCLCE